MSFLNFRRACGALVLALSFSVTACGGDDDKDGDNNDADSNSVRGRCESIADKLYGCDLSCQGTATQAQFVDNCVNAAEPFTEEDRDQIVDASCAEIEDALCGGSGGGACPSGLVCAPIQSDGVCVVDFDDTSISIPDSAQDCDPDNNGSDCPNGFGCLSNEGEATGFCLQICTP